MKKSSILLCPTLLLPLKSPNPSRNMASSPPVPLVLTLNCIEDPSYEQESLTNIASITHIPLSSLANSTTLIPSASAILIPSLSFLPRFLHRHFHRHHLLLCLSSPDPSLDSALASELNLRLIHIDADRSEEIADTVMALILGLLRKTHCLVRGVGGCGGGIGGWMGTVGGLCKGMRRCRGMVLGIVGRNKAAKCLAVRSLAFRMSVLYIDLVNEGREKSRRTSISFPPSARRMDTLNDLLAASDIISLHCSLSDDTMQILNAECLQHIKPGAFIINTGNSQLIDDCALKQLLIDGTVAGCALDGAEGPQWMEAWVREMPNVLILPRSAEYSEEVWMEIREKALAILHSYFVDGVIPANIVSDDDEDKSDIGYEDSHSNSKVKMKGNNSMHLDNPLFSTHQKFGTQQTKDTQISSLNQNTQSRPEGRRSRSGKKGKKRPARVRSRQISNDLSEVESSGNCASNKDDDNALSSRFTSPEDYRNKHVNSAFESTLESTPEKPNMVSLRSGHLLKDGDVIALRAKDGVGRFHVSRQRVTAGGWFLDTLTNVTKRDPAAQFIVDFRSKDTLGLRSFASGGKLLQINRRMEFVFASHSFDVWENWMLEGSCLERCKLVNCRNPLAVLDVMIELLATVSEDDGVARWLE